MQHQKSTVCLEQAARADAREVGHQHIVFGLVFHAAKQGAKHGVVFDQHGRAVCVVVVHGHVHAVAQQQGVEGFEACFFFVIVAGLKQFDVFQHIRHDFLKVMHELGVVLAGFGQGLLDVR